MKYALVGEKLGHSYSKIIHERFFAYSNLSFTYDLVEISRNDFSAEISRMLNEGYSGLNVTIPYKIDIMALCDKVAPEASKIGSVNTVMLQDGKLIGYNTDYHGLRLALEVSGVSLEGKNVVILGTGGASRAVCTLAEDLGCKSITFVSRSPRDDNTYKYLTYKDFVSGDVIVNTTPVGMYPDTASSPFDDLDGFETAVDLIYNPARTLFLQKAAQNGLKTVNGLYMLVAQALYSQSIWQDSSPDIDLINKIYDEMRGL